MSSLDLNQFLSRNKFTREEWESVGLHWEGLLDIYADHGSETRQRLLRGVLEANLSQLLRAGDVVHSTRGRVKDPEHLIAKIIRLTKDEDVNGEITKSNYRGLITDLVGVRVLHNFKREWYPIHRFILDSYDLLKPPIAYYRDGDLPELINLYKVWGLTTTPHRRDSGYRSVHYVVAQDWEREKVIFEIQVRTVFEEAWSEVDHLLRYPLGVNSRASRSALGYLNRVAGIGDEMASFIQEHFNEWETVAKNQALHRNLPDYTELASLAWLLGVGRSDVERELYRATARPANDQRPETDPGALSAEATRRRALQGAALSSVYGDSNGELLRYSVQINDHRVATWLFSHPDRVGMCADAFKLDVKFTSVFEKKLVHPNPDFALEVIRELLSSGVRLWNDPTYQLRQIAMAGPLNIEFSVADFFSYRFLCGLLEDELTKATTAHRLAREVAAGLPIRERLLPSGSLMDFSRRICAGGVAALCAFRREQGDFVLLLHRRSSQVSDGRGQITIVPKAMHQPTVGNFDEEAAPYWTTLREVYEEVFGGESAIRPRGLPRHDWYLENPAIAAIHERKYESSLTTTAIGIDTKQGNYLFAMLVVAADPEYWERYGASISHMWEHDDTRKHFIEVSTRDSEEIRRLVVQENWSQDALFAFCEGLLALKQKFPDAVNLPTMSRRLG